MCNFANNGSVLTALISGCNTNIDRTYGVITGANQVEPQRAVKAMTRPVITCKINSTSTIISIREVTGFKRGFLNLRTKRVTNPNSTIIPNMNEVTSIIISLRGWLLKARTVLGIKNATKCPKNKNRMPQWKGTDPQNSCLPSKNCDDSDE